ncbi:MAG: C10 family peptidase [Clostridium sp.]|nr:C10 family peptidase [Bacteroides sp.]MCM1197721.1 C10 family peptidase [Clostridium sp.]
MKKIMFFCLATTLVCGVSCTKPDSPAVPEDSAKEVAVEKVSTSSNVIPLDEALANLDLFLAEMNTSTKAEMFKTYDLSEVEICGRARILPMLKSGIDSAVFLPDTLMYLVNFSDKEGYAVLSANKLLGEDIYCVTDDGCISTSDFSAAYEVIQNRQVVSKSSIDEHISFVDMGTELVPELIMSSMMIDLQYGKQETAEVNTKAISGTKYGPYLKTKWTQTAGSAITPFNKYTPNHTYAGCVAIAVAQIMQFCRVPESPTFNGISCNWDDMETVYNYNDKYHTNYTYSSGDQVGNFVYEIGKKHNCYVRYDNGSWAVADGAMRTLKNYGYKSVDKKTGFGSSHQKKATSQLRAGRPVYLGGCPKGTTTEGHAWVLDGEWGNYYHINWGWGGLCDGYFAKGVFNTTSRYDKDEEIDKNVGDPVNNGNYTWTYRLILYSL